MKNTMRGQFTIYGLMMTFIVIVLLAALFPTINLMVLGLIGNTTDTTTQSIARLIPVMLMLSVLMIPIVYTLAGRSQREEEG